jgi:hypothetical protein
VLDGLDHSRDVAIAGSGQIEHETGARVGPLLVVAECLTSHAGRLELVGQRSIVGHVQVDAQ